MAQPQLDAALRRAAEWWCGKFQLQHYLESPSMRMDPTIGRLPLVTMRRHPDLQSYLRRLGLPALSVLGYEAKAEGRYGFVRLAALFPVSPFIGGEPDVFALDGDRRSLHRNPPFDDGIEGVSASLCLYFPGDPYERRWSPEYGLLGLFNIARAHLECEQIWRETDEWPNEDAPHGNLATPVNPRPDLLVPPLREPLARWVA